MLSWLRDAASMRRQETEHCRQGRWFTPRPGARVAINKRPRRAPWGGGNQWLIQMVAFLRRHGFHVRFDLRQQADCILMVDPRAGAPATFSPEEIRAYLRHHPSTVCIHRVNENDQHRASADRDDLLARANALADHTVFVSAWVRDYHAARWFDRRKPHSMIPNGAEDTVFHPTGGHVWHPGQQLRLVTHHWSVNPSKGFCVYQDIDRLVAEGRLSETEFWVIGRVPEGSHWRAARRFPPVPSARLAHLLRQCHVYVSGSQWESGPMHICEALQCGLPVLYHPDGGGASEIARVAGLCLGENLLAAVAEMRQHYAELRKAAIVNAPSGERMCQAYVERIQQLIATKRRAAQHVAVFMTRGMSMEGWQRAGMLQRELAPYHALRARLHGITFVSYSGADVPVAEGPNGALHVLCNRWRLAANVYSLMAPVLHARALRRVSVLKAHQLNGAWCAVIAKWIYRKPLVVRCGYVWSVFAEQMGLARWRRWLIGYCERLVVRAADLVMTASATDAQLLQQRHRVPAHRVRVIPNAIDTARFRPLTTIRKVAGLICCVARLEEQKNLPMLFEALCGLPGVRLALIGEGSQHAVLEAMAHRDGVPVSFLGTVPNAHLPTVFNQAEVFVLPSRYEGHPKALLEAMACGTAVLGTSVPGIRDIIQHGQTGYLCERSASALRSALQELLANEALRERLGRHAMAYVAKTCSLASVVKQEWDVLAAVQGLPPEDAPQPSDMREPVTVAS